MSSIPFKVLKRGDSNIYVKYLQYALHIMCWKVKPFDGIFGAGTETAVKNYQKSQNLTQDGLVGENTWKSLNCEIGHRQNTSKFSVS